ncbi:hypothetical protein [Streptomyces microflavus]|uniref:hypothetical protein n=1 Tax=Streptomyces microflavus TaxID=1919 RepID=UPI0033B06CFB
MSPDEPQPVPGGGAENDGRGRIDQRVLLDQREGGGQRGLLQHRDHHLRRPPRAVVRRGDPQRGEGRGQTLLADREVDRPAAELLGQVRCDGGERHHVREGVGDDRQLRPAAADTFVGDEQVHEVAVVDVRSPAQQLLVRLLPEGGEQVAEVVEGGRDAFRRPPPR